MNLALDEALLDAAEDHGAGPALRLWESPSPFVVLGVAQRIAEQVREENCAADGVSILRRCSAGGAVVQGPGCLNYALVLPKDHARELQNIRSSYCWILDRLAEALRNAGVEVQHAGTSDIARACRKFSGNAQRRRRHWLLHHGTLLYAADTTLYARYLREPADRPDYRGTRTHDDFVENLPVPRETLAYAVVQAFAPAAELLPPDATHFTRAAKLATEKYRQRDWTYRL